MRQVSELMMIEYTICGYVDLYIRFELSKMIKASFQWT